MSNTSFNKTVWSTLSKINVSQHIEKKGNLSYLSWTWAYQTLMDNYPESDYSFAGAVTYPDGSAEVTCTVTVREGENAVTKTMWLPVMDNRNNAVINPSARQISDTKMRCLVKCVAMHGLGLYIYAGEDLPQAEAAELRKPLLEDQVDELVSLMEASQTDYDQFTRHFKIKSLSEMTAGQYQNALSILEKKMQRMEVTNESN